MDRSEGVTAAAFCRGLAGTLGPGYRVSLYRRRPPELLEAWGEPGRGRDPDPVLVLLDQDAEATVVNRAVGRGSRVSVLVLPAPGETAGYAVAIEVDAGAFGRAARLLSAMADPDAAGASSGGQPDGHLGDALDRLVDAAEDAVGTPIREMSRAQKQQVVRYLDRRGAFLIKKAVEQVAGRLGVSRFTIYNYLETGPRRGDP